jgi:beta-phosphoglucomutase
MLKGILFDSDGVLVDSEEIYFRVVRDTFQNFGIEISNKEYVRIWMIEQSTTPGAIKDYGLESTVEEVRALKSKYLKDYIIDLQMMPGALDLLERYYGEYPFGVVSSANRKELKTKLGKFGLMGYFKISVSGDDVREIKPKPEPYQKACSLLGLKPRNVLVIEDNPSGVKSAKDAGCKVIARPDGFTKDLDFSLADKIIENFDEINDEMIREIFLN